MSEYPDNPPAKVGRPTLYQLKYPEQVFKLCLLGATHEEMADFFGVNVDTIYEWKNVHPDFSEAIKNGKDVADAEIAQSLYQSALSGNTASQIFWLKNRKPTYWRDKREIENTGDAQGVTVVVQRFEDEPK